MDKKNYSFKIEKYFNINISTFEEGQFSYYLYKKDKIIQKVGYSKNQVHSFSNLSPGNYRVKVFKKTLKEVQTILSNQISIRNISPTTSSYSEVVLDYANYDLAWISLILKDNLSIEKYLFNHDTDPNFLDLTPVNLENVDSTTKILTCNSTYRYNDKYIYISLSHNSDNPLNEYLSRKSTVDLYKTSKYLYEAGFEKGAHYIWIFMRKNSGCSISYKTTVGENFNLGLGGINTIIHPNSVIGNNVKIAQQVTIGFSGGSNLNGPVIGDNVYIAPGAMCLGGKIGSNVVIASNSVVLNEVPDNCVVAGAPAKIISTDMDKYKNFIR